MIPTMNNRPVIISKKTSYFHLVFRVTLLPNQALRISSSSPRIFSPHDSP